MFNVCSLRKNFSLFLACFSYVFIYFSFILLTDTWLDPDFTDTFNSPGFYKFDFCRNNYGGGVRHFLLEMVFRHLFYLILRLLMISLKF